MATTTPNFGWAVPTSTDLVKDGAVAIETLGDSIDASLVDLKGGTTNQVLAKNSNTDMDFKWVSGMTNPLTTTGDTIYSSSGSTPARLAIGSTGQVLTVSGGVPVWATAGGGSTGPSFSAVSNNTQSISAATNTKVTLQVENWDTAGNFASSRFTPTTAGYYQINAGVSYEVGSNNTVRVNIYKNGSQFGLGFSGAFSGANPGPQYVNIVYLNGSTDYVELYAWCENAATVYRGELSGAQVRS